jgi:plastocyanin
MERLTRMKEVLKVPVRLAAMAALLLIPLVSFPAACGDDDNASREPAASFPAGGDGDGVDVREFEVALNDNWFDPVALTVAGGTVIQLNISNSGAAIHNLRIAGADNSYNDEDDAVSDPSLINAGETAVVQWASPVAGGTFDFRCDFHPEAMVGTITVEQGEEPGGGGEEGP